jgi:uncharacterized FAD-dependent dehydrogenase
MNTSVDITIRRLKSGKRMAFYRQTGTQSRYWYQMTVRKAEKALRDGKVSIGVDVDCPVVAVP